MVTPPTEARMLVLKILVAEGACEVVEDQKTGLLVPIGDVQRMAEAIIALLEDEGRRRSFGEKAIETVNARFSLSRIVDDIEEIYLS